MATFAGMDLTFKLLVGLAFVQVMGGDSEALWHWLPRIVVPSWFLWCFVMWFLARPLDHFAAAERAGEHDDAILQRAAIVSVRLPRRMAIAWSLHWSVTFLLVAMAVGTVPSVFAIACFIVALTLGPYPLAHALTAWLVAPAKREVDRVAHAHGVTLAIPKVTLRSQLMVYAFCLSVAPTAYMASIGVASLVQRLPFETVMVAVNAGFGAVAVFAVLTTLLVSSTLTRPVTDMADVVRNIARKGGEKLGRIPQQQRDEIGVLVELTNEMLDRLERTEREREFARATLEDLNRNLEERVKERTDRLVEARAVIEQEKAQREKAGHELAVARRIQTSILPRQWSVKGLDIAATMVTATEVGGDYYDILPRPFGGWIGIGDVSGHGVGAGLIMMMLQSITATLVDARPNASTRDLVIAIDRVLAHNIRQRLGANDFVTFTLLRYEDGHVRFAGAHEELIVWRAKTGRCERIETPGPWVGVSGALDKVTVESELHLDDGDLLVLYTDGITEARAADRSVYGMDRLCETIEHLARDKSPEQIGTGVIEAALHWCARQEDDMSIVVARRESRAN